MITTNADNGSSSVPRARGGSGPSCPRCGSTTPMEPDVLRARTVHGDSLRAQLATWRCPECGCVQPRLDG